MQLVHIVPFDRRGVMSYALRVPYHIGFIEALKILIVPLKRNWSDFLRAWIVDISEVGDFHRVLNVMFFPEEFCTFCWTQKPCVEWLGDIPRTEGRVLPWPSESRHPTEGYAEQPKPAKKRAKKAPKPPGNPPEPRKPRKPKAPKVNPPETKAEPQSKPWGREERTEPPPRVASPPPPKPPPPKPSSIPPHRPVRGVASAENVLGVRFPYTVADVKSAFRRKALVAHPDRPGGSTEAFLRVSEARDLLLQELGETTSK